MREISTVTGFQKPTSPLRCLSPNALWRPPLRQPTWAQNQSHMGIGWHPYFSYREWRQEASATSHFRLRNWPKSITMTMYFQLMRSFQWRERNTISRTPGGKPLDDIFLDDNFFSFVAGKTVYGEVQVCSIPPRSLDYTSKDFHPQIKTVQVYAIRLTKPSLQLRSSSLSLTRLTPIWGKIGHWYGYAGTRAIGYLKVRLAFFTPTE